MMWEGSAFYSLAVVLGSLSLLSAIDASRIQPADSKIASLHRKRCIYSTLGHLFFKRVKSYDLLKLSQWQNVDSSKLKVALVVPFIFFVAYIGPTLLSCGCNLRSMTVRTRNGWNGKP